MTVGRENVLLSATVFARKTTKTGTNVCRSRKYYKDVKTISIKNTPFNRY